MEKRELRSNYIIAFINLFLFLIFFCFSYSLTKELVKTFRLNDAIKIWVLFLGLSFPFIFYTFIVDLNNAYEKVQHFFFRGTFLNLVIPSILIILLVGYFIFPKMFNISFNRNMFLFLGSFSFAAHLVFAARETKSASFTGFINYFLSMTMIYIFILFLFGVYLLIGYDYSLKTVIINGTKNGFSLIKEIILQLFP
ncbi:MAG: hypothetical protein B1H08_03625 [Candidatus Omnitrophica bacterium 4484_171]|nr:MAG: hypothetical protein B1H08_03625 [Candidatus Omnitrophica bacterium 4484_171]